MLTRKGDMTNNGTSMPWNSSSQSSEEGYWIHKDTGVKTIFGLDADFIVNDVFGVPSWKMDASEIYVPEGITAIGATSLSGATNLVTLNLPSTLTEIRAAALDGCTGLINFYIKAIIPPSFVTPAYIGNFSTQAKVPAESYDAYRVAPTWSAFIDNIFILNDLIPGSRVHSGYANQDIPLYPDGESNLVFENLIFDGAILDPILEQYNVPAVGIWNCNNIIIRNCKFVNITKKRCIMIGSCTNVSIYNCDFIGVWFAILVTSCKGRIRIFSNDFHNIKGSLVNVSEGGPVQFTYCTGGGYRCQDNAIEQVRDESSIIDHISTFMSHFDPNDPYIVRNNWIRGGGPSPSSGGILLGDYGGSNMIMEDNILVNPGQYGIAVAGGSNMVMRRNKVYGEQLPWSNVGIVVVNWTWEIDGPSENITVGHNRVNWIGSHGGDAPFWVWEYMQWPNGWETNVFQDPTITPNILPAEIVGV